MLVLTRKVGEGITIGDDIKIIVMQIKGKQVRLGIKASPDTVVHREEVFNRIQEENRQAAKAPADAPDAAAEVLGNPLVTESGAVLKKNGRKTRGTGE